MDDKQWERRYERLGKRIKRRIVQIRDSGRISWQQPDTSVLEDSPEWNIAVQHNLKQLNGLKDRVYNSLMKQLKDLFDNTPPSYITPEGAAVAMCRDWLETYPVEYQRIQNMRFVG
jgi:hypothetical protein